MHNTEEENNKPFKNFLLPNSAYFNPFSGEEVYIRQNLSYLSLTSPGEGVKYLLHCLVLCS